MFLAVWDTQLRAQEESQREEGVGEDPGSRPPPQTHTAHTDEDESSEEEIEPERVERHFLIAPWFAMALLQSPY